MVFVWRLFKKFLLSRRSGSLIRTVSWICICGVTVGVAALIIILSVMNGFNRCIRERILAVEPHLVVQNTSKESMELKALLEKDNRIKSLFDLEKQDVILRSVDGFISGAVAWGVSPESLTFIIDETQRVVKKQGGVVKLSEKQKSQHYHLKPGEVLMGIELANALEIFDDDVVTALPPESLILGAETIPHFGRLKVKGFLQSNYRDIDRNNLYYLRSSGIPGLKNTLSKEAFFEIRLHNLDHVIPVKAELQEKGAKVETWMDRNSNLFFALRMEKLVVGLLVGLSTLIAGFSIATVLILLLTQKKKEISIFMSMGMSQKKARSIFTGLGIFLSSIGVFSGFAIGLLVSVLVDKYSSGILPDIYYETNIPAKIDAVQLVILFSCSALFCTFISWLSAKHYIHRWPSEGLAGTAKPNI